jgi:hypothetical protein
MKRFLAHLVGDYLLQTHYEASEKTNSWLPAVTHAGKYTVAFLPLTRNPKALAVIGGTHLILDHYRLAKHLAWAKNQAAPKAYRPVDLSNNGYPAAVPGGLSLALMIIADNTTHLLINEWALDRWNENGV